MKYAIISDIHANLEALDVVLAKCRELGVTEYISLGDVVGYNANPKECLSIIRSLNLVGSVKGNHDEYVSNGDNEMLGFNPHAKNAVIWTRSQLNEEELHWLSTQPMRATVKGLNTTIVHATLDSPEAWGYVFDVHHATDNFSYQFTQLCFCGHSHVPIAFYKKPTIGAKSPDRSIDELGDWAWRRSEEGEPSNPNEMDSLSFQIQPGWKYLVNIGSVGQPRNRDPRSSFAVYDDESRTITRWRVPYDIKRAQAKILEAGLPERLAARLEHGK